MKRIMLTALAVASFLAGGNVFAQNMLRATVPFNFYVGDAAMPSGPYQIAPCADHILMVRHCTKCISAMQGTVDNGRKAKDKGLLVFHKYGDKYFLSEVQGLPVSGRLVLLASLSEKREQTSVRTYETVTVPEPAEQQQPK